MDLPPKVAKAFFRDMRAYFKAKDQFKADEIAANQLHILKQHHKGRLRLSDVKKMFDEMRELDK